MIVPATWIFGSEGYGYKQFIVFREQDVIGHSLIVLKKLEESAIYVKTMLYSS